MLCRIFFQIYIKIKTEITEIDIAERYQRTDNQKLKLILLILISLKDIKEADNQKLKLTLLKLTSLKDINKADKPPYQRVSSESRQAHSHRIPSFPIAIP